METTAYALFSAFIALIGATLIGLAWSSRRQIEQSSGDDFLTTPMTVLDVNLVRLNSSSEAFSGPMIEKTSMVLVKYQYSFDGSTYQCRQIFPLDIEWMRPRVSPFDLFEDLKSQRLTKCFVDKTQPSKALLFQGWSPYLKRHIAGVFGAGVLVFVLGCLAAFYLSSH